MRFFCGMREPSGKRSGWRGYEQQGEHNPRDDLGGYLRAFGCRPPEIRIECPGIRRREGECDPHAAEGRITNTGGAANRGGDPEEMKGEKCRNEPSLIPDREQNRETDFHPAIQLHEHLAWNREVTGEGGEDVNPR